MDAVAWSGCGVLTGRKFAHARVRYPLGRRRAPNPHNLVDWLKIWFCHDGAQGVHRVSADLGVLQDRLDPPGGGGVAAHRQPWTRPDRNRSISPELDPSLFGERSRELRAGADRELAVHARQVNFNRPLE
jgi:hypothetical protein